MSTENIQIVATARDNASPALRRLRGNVAALGSRTGGPVGGMLGGLAAINPIAIAASAGLGILTAKLIEGVAGALEEDKQYARLGATLRANVPHWDGSTAAVDRATTAAMDLSFSDDDARESMIKLITATGNVEQSTKDMSLAMDIARGRNISLSEATDIVAKANIGNTRALKAMGIEIHQGATATEILIELQKRYGGQAEAYAQTTAGRFEGAQVKVNNAMEDFGHILINTTAGLLSWGDAVNGNNQAAADYFHTLGNLGIPLMNELGDAAQRAANKLGIVTDSIPKPSQHPSIIPGYHAAGGDMKPGEVSWVGERGPELIQAGRQGVHVTPNHALGGGHGHNIILNGRLLGQAVDEYLGRQLSLAPSGVINRG